MRVDAVKREFARNLHSRDRNSACRQTSLLFPRAKPVAGVNDLHRLLTDAQEGARCTLTVIRHSEKRIVPIIPEEAR